MSPKSTFSAAQNQVLTLVSSGSTIAASASQAGIHRNTVYNWLRFSGFRDAMEQARYDNAIYWHEQATTLAEAAFNTLAEILDNPEAPASLRARIALAITDRAATPPPSSPFVDSSGDAEEPETSADPADPVEEAEDPAMLESPDAPAAAGPQIVPNSAQSPSVESSKIGRNEPCPCGSGVKFKRCCLDKTRAPAVQPPSSAAGAAR